MEVYNNQHDFFKKAIVTQTVKATNEKIEFSFDLPHGDYALAAYQDLNENKVLDKGWFSIPKEPYGLSNNYRPKFSAPTFEDCRFALTKDTALNIILK